MQRSVRRTHRRLRSFALMLAAVSLLSTPVVAEMPAGASSNEVAPQVVMSTGVLGSGPGSIGFVDPRGVAQGPGGELYVVDAPGPEGRLQVLSTTGDVLDRWHGTSGAAAWRGVAVAPDGRVFLSTLDGIEVRDEQGLLIETIDDDALDRATGMVIAADRLYVAEEGNGGDIEVFTLDGEHEGTIAAGENYSVGQVAAGPDGSTYSVRSNTLRRFGPDGDLVGTISPGGLTTGAAVTPTGNLFVTTQTRLYLLEPDGTQLSATTESGVSGLGSTIVLADGRALATSNNGLRLYGSDGTAEGSIGAAGRYGTYFDDPRAIDELPNGDLVVADRGNHRVQRLSPDGEALGAWGSQGAGPGQFARLADIAAAPDGGTFTLDSDLDRVQRFDASGNQLDEWPVPDGTTQLAVDDDGDVWIPVGSTFQQRSPSGALLSTVALTFRPHKFDLVAGGGFVVLHNQEVRRLGPDGTVLASRALNTPSDVSVGPHGNILTRSGLLLDADLNTLVQIPLNQPFGLPTATAIAYGASGRLHMTGAFPRSESHRVRSLLRRPTAGTIYANLGPASLGGTVGDEVPATLTLRNTGATPLTGLTVTETGGGGGTCQDVPSALAPGERTVLTCSLPLSTVGTANRRLAVATDQITLLQSSSTHVRTWADAPPPSVGTIGGSAPDVGGLDLSDAARPAGDLAVADDGTVFVRDASSRVIRYEPWGALATSWEAPGPGLVAVSPDGSQVYASHGARNVQHTDASGGAPTNFWVGPTKSTITGLAGADDGLWATTNREDGFVCTFTEFLHLICTYEIDGSAHHITDEGGVTSTLVHTRRTRVVGIDVGPDGEVHVSEHPSPADDQPCSNSCTRSTQSRIHTFDGTSWSSFGPTGTSWGALNRPPDLAVADDGALYELSNGRVQRWEDRTFTSGWDDGLDPVAVAAVDGRVYVLDAATESVRVYGAPLPDPPGGPVTPPGEPATPAFIDVSPGHPFAAHIAWMADHGISTGYQPGPTYRPANAISRGAMAAFMHRLAGRPSFAEPTTTTFGDVSATHPFFTEIEWMASEGITTGTTASPKPLYKPGDPVSRGAMSAFMHRLAGRPSFAEPTTTTFGDVSATHPFFTEIEWMASEGITTGTTASPKPLYKPGDPVSRGAMSAFMHRLADGPGVDLG